MSRKTIEVKTLSEALKSQSITHDTWVVLDLDETVMTSMLGEAWFGAMFAHVKAIGKDPSAEIDNILTIYYNVQHYIRNEPVEKNIAPLIRALQDIGVTVIGLTARGFNLKRHTNRQLAHIDIDLSRGTILEDDEEHNYKGVIYCDGGNKGEILSSLLDKHHPSNMIMLDDKLKHLETVGRTCESRGIQFTGFRYGHLDERTASMDMDESLRLMAHLWDLFPPEAHEAIRAIQLLPTELQGTKKFAARAEHFFDPSEPLTVEKAEPPKPAPLRRCNSDIAAYRTPPVAQKPSRTATLMTELRSSVFMMPRKRKRETDETVSTSPSATLTASAAPR